MNLETESKESKIKEYKEQMKAGKLVTVHSSKFKQLCRSKTELFNILKFGLNLYLPNIRNVSMEFLKSLLLGEKKYYSKHQILLADVPKWREFKVEAILNIAQKNKKFKPYV